MNTANAQPTALDATDVGRLRWRNLMSTTLGGVDLQIGGSAFAGHLRSRDLGGLRVYELSATPSEAHTSTNAAAPGFVITCQLSGTGEIGQSGRVAALGPGDVALFATHLQGSFVLGDDFRSISVRIPPELLDLRASALEGLSATVLSGTPLAPVVGTYFAQVLRDIDLLPRSERPRVLRTALTMVETMLHVERASLDELMGTYVDENAGHLGRGLRLRDDVLDYIDEQLTSADLDPAAIAGAHFVSVRHLHKVFNRGDETVASYIRQRRLTMCQRELADPACQDDTVAEIARRWCFESASHFGRAFREQVGVSPAAYRRSMAAQHIAEPSLPGR